MMMGENGISKRALLLTLLIAGMLRLFFMIVVPPDEKDRDAVFVGYNDERAHYNYVKYLAREHRLPLQTTSIFDTGALESYSFEYYQPPLYYLAAVPFHLLAALEGVRLFSVLLSLGFLALLYHWLRRAVELREAALGITLFLALLLGHVRFSAQVNNDVLLWLLSLVMFHRLFLVLEREGGTPRDWATLGVVAGLGMLTKTSFLTLLAGPPLALLIRRRGRGSAYRIVLFFGVALLLSAPWLIRSKLVYDEWLATTVAVGDPRSVFDADHLLRIQMHHALMLPFQFWSGFENTFSRGMQQNAVMLLLLVGAGALAAAGLHWYRRRRTAIWVGERAFFWGLLASLTGNLAGFLFYAYRSFQGEVRMLFPSLLPGLAYFVLVPLYRTVPRGRRRVLTVGLASCALLPWLGFL